MNFKSIIVWGDSILKGIVSSDDLKEIRPIEQNALFLTGEKLNVQILNKSIYGAPITKIRQTQEKNLNKNLTADICLIESGTNDCDYEWSQVSENPTIAHKPKVEYDKFLEILDETVKTARKHKITPVLVTSTPLVAKWWFDYICIGLNRDNILSFIQNQLCAKSDEFNVVAPAIAKSDASNVAQNLDATGIAKSDARNLVATETAKSDIQKLDSGDIANLDATETATCDVNVDKSSPRDIDEGDVSQKLDNIINVLFENQKKYSDGLKDYALKNNIQLIDLREEFSKAQKIDLLMCKDGVHPNKEGQKFMSEIFVKELKKIKLEQF